MGGQGCTIKQANKQNGKFNNRVVQASEYHSLWRGYGDLGGVQFVNLILAVIFFLWLDLIDYCV